MSVETVKLFLCELDFVRFWSVQDDRWPRTCSQVLWVVRRGGQLWGHIWGQVLMYAFLLDQLMEYYHSYIDISKAISGSSYRCWDLLLFQLQLFLVRDSLCQACQGTQGQGSSQEELLGRWWEAGVEGKGWVWLWSEGCVGQSLQHCQSCHHQLWQQRLPGEERCFTLNFEQQHEKVRHKKEIFVIILVHLYLIRFILATPVSFHSWGTEQCRCSQVMRTMWRWVESRSPPTPPSSATVWTRGSARWATDHRQLRQSSLYIKLGVHLCVCPPPVSKVLYLFWKKFPKGVLFAL